MNSLEVTDKESAAIATAPRVTLQSMEEKIAEKYYVTGAEATGSTRTELAILTMCILVMKNGFTVIGKAAPASPENYNKDLGRKFAYEDAIRQLWPHEGYALREKLQSQAEIDEVNSKLSEAKE